MSDKVGVVAAYRAAIATRARAEVDEVVALAALAETCEWPEDAQLDVIGTRAVRVGADGTALLEEFLALEVAAAKGISVGAATWLIRDVVNLKVRHPAVWRAMVHGRVPVFRACQLAAEIASYGLSVGECWELDVELAPKLGSRSWRRVLQLVRGLVVRIAPEKMEEFHARSRADRYVRKLGTDDPSSAFITARVDTAEAVFFDAMVDRIADLLGEQGDVDPKDARRAKSIGILATPARAVRLLGGASEDPGVADPRLLPEAQVYVHVAEETLLTGRGPARVEDVGALSATLLKQLLGHSRVRLTPVVQPYANIGVDSYEIPTPIRRQVLLRDQFEVFPFSARPARGRDLDHTIPWRKDAPPGAAQTRASNLGPVSRRPHRGKTHGDWRLEQPTAGIFHWTSPSGYRWRVGPTGTHPVEDDDPLRQRLNEIIWDAEKTDGDQRDRSAGDSDPPDV